MLKGENEMLHNAKKSTDLQGLNHLIKDATLGIVDLVEVMHKRAIHPPFLPSTPIHRLISAIADITYKSIKLGTHFISGGLDKALGHLTPMIGGIKSTDQLEALKSVLNGVIGDYLHEKDNPLAIIMQFRHQSKTLSLTQQELKESYPNINGNILILVHGSCMNDTQWTRKEHNHGLALATALDKTPVFLHYNSGLHISSNGKNFNELLEELVLHWPVPIKEIDILTHSMGGLVTRSAFYYGRQQQKTWTKHIKRIVFMGTPHHGAALERIGNFVGSTLDSAYHTKPFARLGKIRSAGITDLRYGNLVDEDWSGFDRFDRKGDQRLHIPLPEEVECYSVAAVIGKSTDNLSARIAGDGLVDIKSALGQHPLQTRHLHFKEQNTYVSFESAHLDLLNHPQVYAKIKNWLA
jgi:pimeloyl-ACP methyl ester carboxylesterase